MLNSYEAASSVTYSFFLRQATQYRHKVEFQFKFLFLIIFANQVLMILQPDLVSVDSLTLPEERFSMTKVPAVWRVKGKKWKKCNYSKSKLCGSSSQCVRFSAVLTDASYFGLQRSVHLWHHNTRAVWLLLWRHTTSVQWGVFLSLRTQGSQPGAAAGYK